MTQGSKGEVEDGCARSAKAFFSAEGGSAGAEQTAEWMASEANSLTAGDSRKDDFHYRSMVGQLNYLTSSTRPDIQFATHQCSRFSVDPKRIHEVAVKRIVRYLKQTADEGTIVKPDKSKGFECYVDADFAGGFSKAESNDPTSC